MSPTVEGEGAANQIAGYPRKAIKKYTFISSNLNKWQGVMVRFTISNIIKKYK
jgi:hypothetical protein